MAFSTYWRGPFELEPLDRFKEVERERAGFLVRSAVAKKNQESSLKLPPIPGGAQGAFNGAVAPLAPRKEKKSKWDRLKGGIDAVTPDALEGPAKTAGKGALTTINLAQDYVGAPIMGLTSGRLGAPQQTGPNGEKFREGSPSWTEFGKGIKKAVTQNPVDTYNESRQAFREGQNDPDLPAWKRIAAENLSDPLTYIGPGAVKGALKAAPAAVRTSKAARFAGAILEDPRRVQVGGVLGSSAAGQAAQSMDLPAPLQMAAPIVGGIAGGITGGLSAGIRNVPADRPVARPGQAATQNLDRLAVARGKAETAELALQKAGYSRADVEESVFRDMLPTSQGVPEEEIRRSARELLEYPEEFRIEANAFLADARKRGDIKTPYRENIDRIGNDAEAIARGRQALKARIASEKSKGGITPSMAESANWFIDQVPERYVDRLASSYLKRGEAGIAGQYVATDPDVEDGIIRIFKGVARQQGEPERVIIHEIGHHLEQFVDDADYVALRSQWEREMGTRGGILPGSGEGGQDLVDAVDEFVASKPKDYTFTAEETAPGAQYRYSGGFGEWFAENIADRALRDFDKADEVIGPWRRAWEAIKDMADVAYRFLLRRGEKDAAERVYRNLIEGKYLESTRALRDPMPVQNMAGQANLGNFSDRISAQRRKMEEALNPDSGITGPAQASDMAGARVTSGQAINQATPPLNQATPSAQPAAVPGGPTTPGRSAGTVPPAGGSPTPPAGGLPKEDLFDTIGRSSRLAEEARFKSGVRGKVDTAARELAAKGGGERLDKNLKGSESSVFTVKEKTRIDMIRSSYKGQADDLYARMLNTGVPVKRVDGVDTMPNGATFQDMFEEQGALGRQAFASLEPDQKAAIQAMRDFNERLNANLRFHNKSGTLGWDASTDYYFPRQVVGRDGRPRVNAGASGSKVGSTRPHSKPRTYDQELQKGIDAGLDYGDARNAWSAMVNGKLRDAQDQYLVRMLKPLSVTKKNIPAGEYVGVDWVQVPRDVAPALSGRYFRPEDAQQITAALTDDPAAVVKFITEANKILTPFRATADLSWFAQQGSAAIFRHPTKAIPAALRVIKSALGDRKAYDKLIDGVGVNLDEAIQHGLKWTGDDLPDYDFALPRIKATKPGVKQAASTYNAVADFSNETFGRYTNWVRAQFTKDAQVRLNKMKGQMSPEEWRKEYQGAMSAINRMTGSTARKVTSGEGMFFFAPRYFSATVEQLAAGVAKGGIEGSLARQHLMTMFAMGSLGVIMANKARGYETEYDPRSPNFMRLRHAGGLDVSMFGTYDTLVRAIAGTVAGEPGQPMGPDIARMWKLAEGKMSPGLKMIYEPFIKQSTYTGEPLDPTSKEGWKDIAANQAVNSLPFSLSNLIQEGITPAIQERDPKELIESLPGLAFSSLGNTNSPVTPSEYRNWRRDKLAAEIPHPETGETGRKYDELSGTEKSIVNEDRRVMEYQTEADKNVETREDDRSNAQQAGIEAHLAIQALSENLESKKISGTEFRKRYQAIQQQKRGAYDVLQARQSDPDIEGYYALYDQATRPDKSLDYEKLEPLMEEYVATHPGILDKIDGITGVRDNATMRRFRIAQDQAQEYYALPAYEGLTVEEGERVRPILDVVRRAVNNGQTPSYVAGLKELAAQGAITEEEMMLAYRARKVGRSLARKEYERTHPEYAEFYNDALTDDTFADIGTYAGGSSRRSLKLGTGIGPRLPEIPKVGLNLPKIGVR